MLLKTTHYFDLYVFKNIKIFNMNNLWRVYRITMLKSLKNLIVSYNYTNTIIFHPSALNSFLKSLI